MVRLKCAADGVGSQLKSAALSLTLSSLSGTLDTLQEEIVVPENSVTDAFGQFGADVESSQSFSIIQRRMFSRPHSVPCEEGGGIVNLGDAAKARRE